MKNDKKLLMELLERYPPLRSCETEIQDTCECLLYCVRNGGKVLMCGNGGSCADCEHISGELLKGFRLKRLLRAEDRKKWEPFEHGSELAEKLQYGICAIPLPSLAAAMTAFCNDVCPEAVYAQLVLALGKPGDALICISTSGNSQNVLGAAITAKALGITAIGLTGESGGKLAALCDICIRVPSDEPFLVQELHLPVYHCVCAVLEAKLFGGC